MLDIVHWEVHLRESGQLAERFMQHSFVANGYDNPYGEARLQ